MPSLVRRAADFLRKNGSISLLRRFIAFVKERYWLWRQAYTLSINNYSVTFSAPNYDALRRNLSRYDSEREELEMLLTELSADDVFYDIGANTGLYSLFAAEACSRVIAFEPYIPNSSLIQADKARNSASNIDVVELALSNENGKAAFHTPSVPDIGYGSASISKTNTSETTTVKTITGDTFVTNTDFPPPTVVKIDVEGAESLVLEGMMETLKSPRCRLVFCEVHSEKANHRPSIESFNTSLAEIENIFRECGFSVEERRKRSNEVFLRAAKGFTHRRTEG